MVDGWVNRVELVGRVTSEALDVELPSGQTLCRMRIVVPRDKPVTRVTVDTIDVVAFKAAVRKRMHTLAIGDVIHVEGVLRRRFWRAGAAAASRVEVEVGSLRRA